MRIINALKLTTFFSSRAIFKELTSIAFWLWLISHISPLATDETCKRLDFT